MTIQSKQIILAVDDAPKNITILTESLGDLYRTVSFPIS